MKKTIKNIIASSSVLKIFFRMTLNFKGRHWDADGRKIAEIRKKGDYTAVFDFIYANKFWYSEESVSGSGSTLKATEELRKQLQELITRYSIKRILDVPCGDFHWMKEMKMEGISYIGGDLVQELIDNLNNLYRGREVSFRRIDLVKDVLPESDILLIRDCFIHFSNELIQETFLNIKKSNIRYVLTSHFPDCQKNLNINVGEFREINLCLPPFNFPKPLKVIKELNDNELAKEKSMALWEIDSLKTNIK